mmetsp:Transcript_3176/g.4028  ORF Transcript_3176/g.4028 Transcript_3176/m.4028 type:complete len:101 (+) Transcript_3176:74-376(+)
MLAVCPYVLDTAMFRGAFQCRNLVDQVVLTLFPPLKVADVASRVFDAMCWGEHFVILPNKMRILPRVLHVLPVPIMDFMLGIVGGKTGMDGFVGNKLKTM